MVNNKRGQGESSGSIVVFVLILLVAAVIAYATYSFFSKVNTIVDGQDLETKNAMLSCQTSLSMANTEEDKLARYCSNFIYPAKVGGKLGYVSCAFLEKSGSVVFTEDQIPTTVKDKCDPIIVLKMAYNKCEEFNTSNELTTESWSYYINGRKCDKKFSEKTFGLEEGPSGDSKRFDLPKLN